MAKDDKPSQADAGAALLAWYSKAIRKFPGGLVTQAQAATMLGLSRMAVSRLVTRGHLRAVYFPEESENPEEPNYVGVAVDPGDPMWLKMLAWLGEAAGTGKTYAMPKAAYVSFDDVLRLWKNGSAKEKCKRDWNEVIASSNDGNLATIQAEKRKMAAKERADEEATPQQESDDGADERNTEKG